MPKERSGKTTAQWAEFIRVPWDKTVDAFVETGKRLIEAKKHVPHGEWGGLFTEGYPKNGLYRGPLPFSQRIANMLMRIARHPVISNSKNFSNLPASYSTLYLLSFLSEGEAIELIEDGKINPSLLGSEAKVLGMTHPDRAFRSLRLLCEICRYLKPQELAQHWDEDVASVLGKDEIRELERLAPYIAELHVELWERYEQTDMCMEGWKGKGIAVNENRPAAKVKRGGPRKDVKEKRRKKRSVSRGSDARQ